MAGIPHAGHHVIAPEALAPINALKKDYLGDRDSRLHLSETLIALTMSAQTNPEAARALEQMPKIHGLDFHSTVLITADDEAVLRKLRVNAPCEPKTEGGKLF